MMSLNMLAKKPKKPKIGDCVVTDGKMEAFSDLGWVEVATAEDSDRGVDGWVLDEKTMLLKKKKLNAFEKLRAYCHGASQVWAGIDPHFAGVMNGFSARIQNIIEEEEDLMVKRKEIYRMILNVEDIARNFKDTTHREMYLKDMKKIAEDLTKIDKKLQLKIRKESGEDPDFMKELASI